MSPFGACPSSIQYLCCHCKAVGPLDPNHSKIFLGLIKAKPTLLTSACLTAILITSSYWQDNHNSVHQIVPSSRYLATAGGLGMCPCVLNTVYDSVSILGTMENKNMPWGSLGSMALESGTPVCSPDSVTPMTLDKLHKLFEPQFSDLKNGEQ